MIHMQRHSLFRQAIHFVLPREEHLWRMIFRGVSPHWRALCACRLETLTPLPPVFSPFHSPTKAQRKEMKSTHKRANVPSWARRFSSWRNKGFLYCFPQMCIFFPIFFFALTVIWNSLAYPSSCKLHPKAAVIALISLHANVTDIHGDVFTCMISAKRERLHWTVLDSFVTLQRPLGFSCWCSRAFPTKEITAILFYFVLQVHFFEYHPLMVLGRWQGMKFLCILH